MYDKAEEGLQRNERAFSRASLPFLSSLDLDTLAGVTSTSGARNRAKHARDPSTRT